MKGKPTILLCLAVPILVSIPSCRNYWDDYYQPEQEHVNMKMWDAIRQEPRFSLFVSKLEEFPWTAFSRGT